MQTMTTQTAGFLAPTLHGLKARIAALRDEVRARRASRTLYRQTVHELSRLDTRELDDLNISRCDIPRIAREATREA